MKVGEPERKKEEGRIRTKYISLGERCERWNGGVGGDSGRRQEKNEGTITLLSHKG